MTETSKISLSSPICYLFEKKFLSKIAYRYKNHKKCYILSKRIDQKIVEKISCLSYV